MVKNKFGNLTDELGVLVGTLGGTKDVSSNSLYHQAILTSNDRVYSTNHRNKYAIRVNVQGVLLFPSIKSRM
jgi:hypothetical protein